MCVCVRAHVYTCLCMHILTDAHMYTGKAVYSGEMKTEDIKNFISINQLAVRN
jgi:hypothetical protein